MRTPFGIGSTVARGSVRSVLGLTLAFAWLSFRYFERPFLALKGRFQRVPSGANAH